MKRVLAFAAALMMAAAVAANSSVNVLDTRTALAESAAIKENKKKISTAQGKLDELEKKQAELDEQIEATKDDISKEQENQDAINAQIETVQDTILTLEDSIEELNNEIASLEDQIGISEIKIKNKKIEIDDGIADFKKRLRAMYVAGNSSYTDILIGADDFYDMLMKLELVKRVADHDNTMIDNLNELKNQYEADEAQLEADKAELEENKEALNEQVEYHTAQKQKLDELYAQSEAVMEQLEADKETYESNKAQIDQEQAEFEAQIQKLLEEQEAIKKKEEEERKKAEEEARRKAEEERQRQLAAQQAQQQQSSGGSGTTSSGNSTSTNSSTGTTSNSGQTTTDNSAYGYTQKTQFTWPVPGYYHISYGIGWRWGSYHKGIDIWSPGIRGAKICAAAAGTVILVSNTCPHDYGKNYSCGCGGGYGNYCIIDHGGGYWTLYGHSQRISVSQGQHVNQGDVLGIVGSTGHSTGDHLHFEVRLNGVAQNPVNYV
ncbi:MAG: peptidoglycan DD-metalloendopeptidase family protein [Ruminococcus sp.]|nr:peptidoglycan DD-metalloendopeptidase family protein [Ruminococcus sp.]